MLTWGCYPPSVNAIRMARKQLGMPRKFSKFKLDCGVFPGELCWDGRRINDAFPECLLLPLTTRDYFVEQMEKKNLKLSLQIWSACLRLETFLSANSLSEKARLATKYIKSCWIVLSPTGKEKKCPKQLTNSTGAGTWYCNQLLHGNMETRMIAVAQE